MKRLLVLALLALGLTIALAPAASPAGDAKGPPCSNITNAERSYSSAGVVDITVFLQKPACANIDYSFFVTDTGGNPIGPAAIQDAICSPETPDGGCTHFVVDLGSGGPGTICISATTEKNNNVADIAPDVSDPTCPEASPSISLVKNIAGASGGFG